MNAYELLYFVNSALTEEDQAAVEAKVKQTIENQGGKVTKVDEWGKRKLAYPVHDLVDGTYTLLEFDAEPTAIAEMDRIFRIADPIERFVIARRHEDKK